MGVRNYLVEGVSASGKTAVCTELERRGHHAVHGDRVLAYRGDPRTGLPTTAVLRSPEERHRHHLWDVRQVESLVGDRSTPATFFCGGSRNVAQLLHLFDEVFVLEVDADTLMRRLAARADDDWGADPEERRLTLELHRTRQDLPDRGVVLDATVPVSELVDELLARCGL